MGPFFTGNFLHGDRNTNRRTVRGGAHDEWGVWILGSLGSFLYFSCQQQQQQPLQRFYCWTQSTKRRSRWQLATTTTTNNNNQTKKFVVFIGKDTRTLITKPWYPLSGYAGNWFLVPLKRRRLQRHLDWPRFGILTAGHCGYGAMNGGVSTSSSHLDGIASDNVTNRAVLVHGTWTTPRLLGVMRRIIMTILTFCCHQIATPYGKQQW